jgi:hypothetical protein
MQLSIADIERTFLQHLAVVPDTAICETAEERREQIRVAIMKSRMQNKPLPDAPTLTFGEAFELAYRRPCEMRYQERDSYGRPLPYLA